MTTISFPSNDSDQLWTPDASGPTFNRFLQSDAVPDGARHSVHDDCIQILGKGQPPDGPDGRRTGLVLGRVQAGKTISITGVTALARDNRFPLVIILAGTKRNLVGQTSSRLQRDLALDDMHPLAPEWRPVSFSPATPDPSVIDALRLCLGPTQPGSPGTTALITLLKHTNEAQPQGIDRLAEIIEGLDALLRRRLESSTMLIIDDEADEAGLDTSRAGRAATPTYRAINRLRAALPRHTYLQYTASPQALLLVNLVDQPSPDFAHLLEPGPDYCGGETFFGVTPPDRRAARRAHSRSISDVEVATIRARQQTAAVPPSLRRAFLTYVSGVAMQLLANDRAGVPNEERPRNWSMLVHPDVQKTQHQLFEGWVRTMKDTLGIVLHLPETSPDVAELRRELQPVIDDIRSTTGYPEPGFPELAEKITQVLSLTTVIRMNADTADEPQWNQHFSVIAVGGNKLGRGYTLRGLIVTWMPRNPGLNQIDTILQRGRFFGYHRPYLPLCRVFLPDDLRDTYEQIVPHERMLWQSLEAHIGSGRPLRDWRRRLLLETNLRACRQSVVRLLTSTHEFGSDPEWMMQGYSAGPANQDNAERWERFLAGRTLDWRLWPGSDRWLVDQRARYAVVPLRDALELLSEWTVDEADASRLDALLLQLAVAIDERPDELCVLVRPHADAPQPSRTINADGKITQLAQGPDPRGRGDFPGDRGLHDPADPRFSPGDTTTLALYRFDLRDPSGATVASTAPLIGVRPAPRLARIVQVQR